MMKRYFVPVFLLLFSLSSLNSFAAEFSIKDGNGILYKNFDDSKTQGAVFIFFENTDGAELRFSVADAPVGFSWFEYESDPEEAEELTENVIVADDGKSTTLNKVKENHGYFVAYEYKENVCTETEEGEVACEEVVQTVKKYAWIATYKLIKTVTWDEDTICGNEPLKLYIKPAMEYVLAGNTGHKSAGLIERELNISYSTYKREEKNPPGVQTVSENHLADTVVGLTVPFVDTDFTVTDQLGAKLNSGEVSKFVTDTFKTLAVIAFPEMIVNDKQENELDPDNSWDKDDAGNVRVYFSETLNEETKGEFRTSAPLSIDFVSNPSEKVKRYEWHISRNPEFTGSIVYPQADLNSFVFKEYGMHYVKLAVFNDANVCESASYACFEISISALFVPNAFTPDGDGINDEFKVAYKSIESYRCRVYNQWGRVVYDSTDITQGWDGTIGGNIASIGAYFYVIDAIGTDGKNHKKRGDINLIRSK
ncbi:MAG: gliding motility-associated C-terminal domain-containing protein [Prevotellaceae bacterium]|jgi:gliding motility-associated-like protein|nr:gliding motility-associated C-terminal domain-containing protein [Prevotellaceae bacterium]